MRFSLIISICSILLFSCGSKTEEKTTFYLVRHAEKDLTIKQDPPLTEEGVERAKKLATYFEPKNIKAVYSTNYERTRNTATFTAQAKDIEITYYKPNALYSKSFVDKHKGETVLIVGHSNTIPGLVNKFLGENKFEDISESEYDHLYIVTIKDGKANAVLEKM